MRIALDPYMFRRVPLTGLPALVADLGYQYIELSPREDFLPFFLHPRAGRAQVTAFRKALASTGVQVSSVLPLYSWSGPGEDERQAAVRCWKRAIQVTVDLGVDTMNSELNGRPEAAPASEAQFWRSMEDLLPVFEREGIRLVLEPHPDDFIEDGQAAVDLIRGIDKDWVSFLYCAPHTFHQGGDIEAIMRYAGPLLTHVHIADSFDHRASSGLRYIVNPPRLARPDPPAPGHRAGRGRLGRVLRHAVRPELRRHRDRLRVRVGRTRPRVLGPQPAADPAVPRQARGNHTMT
jgi:myo-inositol catabolism protein IolH